MADIKERHIELHLQSYDSIFESVVFGTGKILHGINFDVRPEGCRIILKTLTKGKPEVCFINASTLEGCLETLYAFCHTTTNMGIKWKPDQYYKPSETV